MMTRRYLTALGAFFVVAIGIAACGSSVPGNAVANVGGNPVTAQAFNHWMYVAAKSQAAQSPGQPVIVPNDPPQFNQCIANVRKQIPSLAKTAVKTLRSDCQNLFTSLSSQVMDFLIKAYWYQAQAHKDGIKVSDAEVLNAFNTAKKQQFQTSAQYTSFLSQTGQTQDDILFRFRINEVFKKLLAKQTKTITNAQIASYYNSHLSQFSTPETRDLEIVLTKTQAQANAAKQALSKGQSWASVAKKYSTDSATKNNGGKLLGVVKGQQDAALDSAAFSASLNKLTGPVKGQFGYYLVEVTKIHTATKQTLAQATAVIRQTLTSQQQTSAQTAVDNTAKKNWQSQTSCRSAYAMADCKGYKAPKTTTSSSPTTSSSG
jgi:foldase protein PrsA